MLLNLPHLLGCENPTHVNIQLYVRLNILYVGMPQSVGAATGHVGGRSWKPRTEKCNYDEEPSEGNGTPAGNTWLDNAVWAIYADVYPIGSLWGLHLCTAGARCVMSLM